MLKSELIEALKEKTRFTHVKCEMAVSAVFDSMIDALIRGDRIEIRGFGVFEDGAGLKRSEKIHRIGSKVSARTAFRIEAAEPIRSQVPHDTLFLAARAGIHTILSQPYFVSYLSR